MGSFANGQDVTITHYENEIDAENETNPIVGLYTNTSTTQILYVLMVSNISTECRSIGSYTIGVDPLPNVVVDVPLVQCDIDRCSGWNFYLQLRRSSREPCGG